MYNHDPVPPADPPLPDQPLDQSQVSEARHVLLHVSQSCSELRTSLAAMYARDDQRQLIVSGRVIQQIRALTADLDGLVTRLGDSAEREQ